MKTFERNITIEEQFLDIEEFCKSSNNDLMGEKFSQIQIFKDSLCIIIVEISL